MKTRNILFIIAGLIVLFALLRQCEGEPKVITKTETVIKWKTDTITKTKIDTVPKLVYVNKYVDKKGEKVIVYVDKPNDSTIIANEYKTEIKSDSATAKLNIVTTGELLDVQGIIEYPEKETITTITKIKDKSGFYIYGKAPISAQNFSPEVGIQFNIRNKMFIGSGIQYNSYTNNADVTLSIGLKIF